MKTLWALRKEFPVTGDVEMAFTTIQFLKIVCWHTCELIDNMKFSKPCGHTLVTGTSNDQLKSIFKVLIEQVQNQTQGSEKYTQTQP